MAAVNNSVVVSIAAMIVIMSCSRLFCAGDDNISVKYKWKVIDFEYPSEEARDEDIRNGVYIPKNNVPVGLEAYKDRIFITVPRWRVGVPSTLNYIWLNATSRSPKLIPYPNWDAHRGERPEIASPYRVKADRCGRLWVIDPGYAHILSDITLLLKEPEVLVFDLNTDKVIRKHVFPFQSRFVATLAVDDADCEDAFVYFADVGNPVLVVYSWKSDSSWKVEHEYFNGDPDAMDFNVLGTAFSWPDKLFGVALTGPENDGFSTLFFHPMTSFDEYSVSTKYLRDPKLSQNSHDQFKHLGTRGPTFQAGASVIDKKTGVLYYGLFNKNAVGCWNTNNPIYDKDTQGIVHADNHTMILTCDLKLDIDDNLWILSNRLHIFMFSDLNPEEYNFRILSGPVKQAIQGTACDSKKYINKCNKINTAFLIKRR